MPSGVWGGGATLASAIKKRYIVYGRCPNTSVLDEEMHARYTGVPRHLPRMQEVGERVEYQLYVLATLDGAADMCRPGAPKYLVSHEFSPPQEGSQVRCGKVHSRSTVVRRKSLVKL